MRGGRGRRSVFFLRRGYSFLFGASTKTVLVVEGKDVSMSGTLPEDLEERADEYGWMLADEFHHETDGETFHKYIYETADEVTRIRLNSRDEINGRPVNNVFVETKAIELGDIDAYRELYEAVKDEEFGIEILDMDWVRLASHVDTDLEFYSPEPGVLERFMERKGRETIGVALKGNYRLEERALEEIQGDVGGMEELYELYGL